MRGGDKYYHPSLSVFLTKYTSEIVCPKFHKLKRFQIILQILASISVLRLKNKNATYHVFYTINPKRHYFSTIHGTLFEGRVIGIIPSLCTIWKSFPNFSDSLFVCRWKNLARKCSEAEILLEIFSQFYGQK